jgi:hypothetical protein
MKKFLLAAFTALSLVGCSTAQMAKVDANLEAANKFVVLACQLDAKWVPIGLDAMPELELATGVALTAVGQPGAAAAAAGVMASAADLDKLKLHPAVQALCAGLVGAGAQLVGTPTATAPAAPAVKPANKAPVT